jgi:hypothetical protein
MDIKKTINQALTTKMNRRQFLIQAGGTLLALVGLASIVQALSTSTAGSPDRKTSPIASGNGAYGQSTYGS